MSLAFIRTFTPYVSSRKQPFQYEKRIETRTTPQVTYQLSMVIPDAEGKLRRIAIAYTFSTHDVEQGRYSLAKRLRHLRRELRKEQSRVLLVNAESQFTQTGPTTT